MTSDIRSRASLIALLLLVPPGCSGGEPPPDASPGADATPADAPPSDAPPSDAPAADAPGADAPGSDAGPPGPTSRTTIDAAAGGVATSTDGLFLLFVPPGALAADTEITITILDPADRPAEAAGALGEVYDVGPDGLAFAIPATAVVRFPTAPPGFETAEGMIPLRHQTLAPGGGLETVAGTETIALETGAVLVAAPLDHLSPHWVDRTSEADGVRFAIGMPEGSHLVDRTFVATDLTLTSTAARAAFDATFRAGVSPPTGAVVAVVPSGGTSIGTESQPWGDEDDPIVDVELVRAPARTADLVADVPFHLDVGASPRPTWQCVERTPGVSLYVAVAGLVVQSRVGCHEPSVILLGDSQRVAAGPSGPEFSAGLGAAANVIVPTGATLAAFTELAESSLVEGVTYASELGASPITLTSSAQSVTATHDGSRYALGGLVGARAFAATDTLTVAGTPPGAGAPVSVMVPAPAAITAPGDLLDPPSGTTSTVSWPDGAFDAFVIQVTLSGSTLPGEAQVLRVVAHDDAALEGGRRRARILDDETLAELGTRGLTISEITVGVVNEADCSALFPDLGDVPCQAGRFLRMPLSALLPYVPPACGGPATSSGAVMLCFDLAGGTCATAIGAASCPSGMTTVVRWRPGIDLQTFWPIATTTGGTMTMPNRLTGLPDGADMTIVQSPTATARLTTTFHLEGTTLTPLAVPVYVE